MHIYVYIYMYVCIYIFSYVYILMYVYIYLMRKGVVLDRGRIPYIHVPFHIYIYKHIRT
jgi:hypothetical protein